MVQPDILLADEAFGHLDEVTAAQLRETFLTLARECGSASSDYPRWDFDLPSTIYDLPFLNGQTKRNILGGNTMRVFNLKLPAQKLARVA